MELLTSRFLKTVTVFTGLHALIWLGFLYIIYAWQGGDQTADTLLAILLITGVPIVMMYFAQAARRITGASWQECLFALLVAGPVSFGLVFQTFVFLQAELTIYVIAINLMGIFLLPLWDPQVRMEHSGALAVPARTVWTAAVVPYAVMGLYGFVFEQHNPDFYFYFALVAIAAFFWGMIISVCLAFAKRWYESALVGSVVTISLVIGSCLTLLFFLSY